MRTGRLRNFDDRTAAMYRLAERADEALHDRIVASDGFDQRVEDRACDLAEREGRWEPGSSDWELAFSDVLQDELFWVVDPVGRFHRLMSHRSMVARFVGNSCAICAVLIRCIQLTARALLRRMASSPVRHMLIDDLVEAPGAPPRPGAVLAAA